MANADDGTVVTNGVPFIQFEVGMEIVKFATAVPAEGGDYTRFGTELASAQLAIALAARGDDAGVDLLHERIQKLHQVANPNCDATSANFFKVRDLLTEREQAFLPSARIVVGLTYQAAEASRR